MVATLAGLGALLFGLALLLLPLLATELSRPGDSAWGALVLLLALVLVTSAERLSGSPMLAVISGGLLVSRLTVEVGRGRWHQLTPEERGRLGTRERWLSSLSQARVAFVELLRPVGQQASALLARWPQPGQRQTSGKRWVRPESAPTIAVDPEGPAVIEVRDFMEIDALLQASPTESLVHEEPAPGVGEPPAGERPTSWDDHPMAVGRDGEVEKTREEGERKVEERKVEERKIEGQREEEEKEVEEKERGMEEGGGAG
ncbi:MAG: hypothetical protein RLZZ117_798 [Cyanobacteriota bacterium]